MAHFAKIENNMVTNVMVVPDEQEHRGSAYLNELGFDGEWIQTSYNSNVRKQFAGIGMTYDADRDVFVRPQPHPSWSLDENYDWVPPIPEPEDGQTYDWDEDTLSWVVQQP